MIIVRPITALDAESFYELAFEASLGMTSMPKILFRLQQKVLNAERSFSTLIEKPGDDYYLFVLEDTKTGAIGGASAIVAKQKQLYSYKRESVQRLPPPPPAVSTKISLLDIYRDDDPPSEICSLFVSPAFRYAGQGRLLSLSRFLFIATQPQRFASSLFADLRGFANEDNMSPFWENIGRRFVDLEMTTLFELMDEGLIAPELLLSPCPLCIELLPKEVQNVIGKVHPESLPAANMLLQAGFNYTDEVHIIDAGPRLKAPTQEVRTIKESAVDKVVDIQTTPIEGTCYIVCNNQINFRACLATLHIQEGRGITLTDEVATALQVQKGDDIRYATFYPSIQKT